MININFYKLIKKKKLEESLVIVRNVDRIFLHIKIKSKYICLKLKLHNIHLKNKDNLNYRITNLIKKKDLKKLHQN